MTQNHSSRIPMTDLTSLFQIGDQSVYNFRTTIEGQQNLRAGTISMLEFLGSPAQDVLTNSSTHAAFEATSSQGGIAIVNHYIAPSEDGTPEEWVTLVIGNAIDRGEKYPDRTRYGLEPIFTLSGIIDGADFVPRDLIARKKNAGNSVNIALAETADDFYVLMIYGYAAFVKLLEDTPIKIAELEKLLEPERSAGAPSLYNSLVNADNDESEFQITQSTINNIFQLGNSRYYRIENAVRNKDSVISIIADCIDSVAAAFAPDFAEGNVPLTTDFHICSEPTGYFACYFTYQTQGSKETTLEKKSVFFIGQFKSDTPAGEYTHAEISHMMLGKISPHPSTGEEMFTPEQSTCKIFDKDGETPLYPLAEDETFDTDIIQHLCYARDALERILMGKAVPIQDMADWVNPLLFRLASEHYTKIAEMPAAQFAASLNWRIAEESAGNALFQFAPSTPQ
jgi:hypothetical protein